MPALTSELFGLQHFASNYSLVQVRLVMPQRCNPVDVCRCARWLPERCTCFG